jgi:hypothetical protein
MAQERPIEVNATLARSLAVKVPDAWPIPDTVESEWAGLPHHLAGARATRDVRNASEIRGFRTAELEDSMGRAARKWQLRRCM